MLLGRVLRRHARAAAVSLLIFALFYAALWDSGFRRLHWTIALVAVSLTGITRLGSTAAVRLAPALPPATAWSMVLLPGYVALQLVPLPLVLLRLVTPVRAHSLEALAQVMPPAHFAAISVNSAGTWENLVRITGYLVVILLVRELSWRSAARGWQMAWPIILLAVCEAALGIVQVGAWSVAAPSSLANRGTYPNRDHFSALLEMAFPFAAMGVFAALRKRNGEAPLTIGQALLAALPGAAALLMLLGILGSLSRMGPVACAGATFVMVLTGLMPRLPVLGKAALVVGTGSLVLASFLYLAPVQLMERYDLTGVSEPRWGIWRDSLHLATHYPATGSGLGTFYDVFQTYQTSDVTRAYVYAHNDYLQAAGELGVPGFLIVAVLLVSIALRTMRVSGRAADPHTRYLALACLGAMVALFIHSFVDYIAYVPADALVFAWILGIAVSLDASSAGREQAVLPKRWLPLRLASPGPGFFRYYSLAASVFLLLYAAAWLVFDPRLGANALLERTLCHAGLCDTDGLVTRARQLLNTAPTSSASALDPAAASFQEALRRTPDAPLIWCDMGEIERRAAKIGLAGFCYGRAHALAPNSPLILWQLVHAELGIGEPRQAFKYASALLVRTRVFDQTVFSAFAPPGTPVKTFLSEILPQNADANRSYLRFLIQRRNVPGAITAWEQILPRGYVDAALANEQVAFLLKENHPEAGARAWSGYLGNRAGDFRKDNALFNGDFEFQPSGALLDWTLQPMNGAKIALDPAVHFSGAKSLRICLDGPDFDYFDHVWQIFAIDPGAHRLEAYVRTQTLAPAQGVQLRIVSWPKPGVAVITEAASATTDWTRVMVQFTVPNNVASARIDVIHQASPVHRNLQGCAWIDDVRVK